MQFALENHKQLIKWYVDEKLSASEIAKKLGTYTLKVTRALKFLKIEIRDKSETQALVLEKIPHPTKGKRMSEETKQKISTSVHNKWKSFSDEKRLAIKEECKRRWDNYSLDHIEALRAASVEGIRRSSKEGSKLELYLMQGLRDNGYKPHHHFNPHEKEKLEVDIYIPELKVAVEIDGPSHFFPIWGDDALAKVTKADSEKNGLLALNGFCVIRIRNLVNKATDVLKRNLLKNLIEVLEDVKRKFPPKSERLMYLDIETGEV